MNLRRALIIVTVFALAANATPSLADAPTLNQKVDAIYAAIAKANAKEKPVLLAVLHDVLAHANEPGAGVSPVPAITKTEERDAVLAGFLLGQRDSFNANAAMVNAYAATAQNAANAADDCRKATQVVTSTSAASTYIENPHHMHFAQGFVALLPVLFMLFHTYPACDKPIVVPTPGASSRPIGDVKDLDELLTRLGIPKQP